MGRVEKRVREQVETRTKFNSDPLGVLQSTAEVIEHARFVSIVEEKLSSFAHRVAQRIKKGSLLNEEQFGSGEISSQRVFALDVVNFCFWAPKGERKWTVEFPEETVSEGWTGLVACFDRAIAEGIPILDADFLSSMTEHDAQHLFRPHGDTSIPFLQERLAYLREAGRKLRNRFDGSIENLLTAANSDAPTISRLIIDTFQSFSDTAAFEGKPVHFYKRAQICAYDLSLLPTLHINNTDKLSVFADYKLPQALRHVGILAYDSRLAQKVDSLILLEKGSREEVEIRASTIWACELLSQELEVPATIVDNAIWSLSGSLLHMKPYHRTLTTSY